jgi:hypothetical protein
MLNYKHLFNFVKKLYRLHTLREEKVKKIAGYNGVYAG